MLGYTNEEKKKKQTNEHAYLNVENHAFHAVVNLMPPRKQNYRVLDYVFFIYFLAQIPSTIFFDTQGVYPEWLYPSFNKTQLGDPLEQPPPRLLLISVHPQLQSMKAHYLETYRDPFLADAWEHPWYLAVCLTEHYIEVPFFFWATFAYWKDIFVRDIFRLISRSVRESETPLFWMRDGFRANRRKNNMKVVRAVRSLESWPGGVQRWIDERQV
ncbi:hypothetical protein EGW08_004430 [Elysia chlorotica]|uniref:EXPERA domain-containing protein n=1 Tax=Elysia chlorotica TaxID=188477 RepID=A0A3S0ZVL7_ELYCH|nr:hypothetical protein EGW08_004430 [Elysia chlorotica]